MSPLIPRAIADFTTQLSSAISVGSTSFTLASILDDDGTSIPDGKYCFTIDNGSSEKEYLMGDNVAGTVSNVKSVSRQGVETTGAARAHRIGASVILTDFAVIQRVADILRGASTLDGSLPLAYDTAPTLSSGLQVATVAYVLSIVTGGAVTFDKQIISGVAGETLASPNIVYLKEADARWWKADADLTATFASLKIGVAQGSASAAAAVNIQLNGIATGFSGLTPGEKQYLSNTAGGVSNVAGTNEFFIGWAITSTTILLAFNEKNIPTTAEKSAMGGTQGTPGSSNKFVTQDNLSVSTTDQSQTTQNGSSETGEADATTKKNILAQSFIPAKTKIRGVKLYKSADTGSFVGTVTITLEADSSGSPSGTPLATRTLTNAEWLALSTGEFEAIFTSEYASLTVGSLYWIVIDPSTSDNSNHPNLGTNTAGGYGSGSAKYKNTTDGWVAISTIDLYFKTLEGNASQVPKTGTDGFIDPALIGTSKKIYISTTEVTFTDGNGGAGAGSEQTLFSTTIPKGLLGTNNAVRFKVFFRDAHSNGSASAWVLKVKYGGSTQLTMDSGSPSSHLTDDMAGFLEGYIVADGATNAQKISATLDLKPNDSEVTANASVEMSKMFMWKHAAGAIDSTLEQTLVITLTQTSQSTNDAVVEWCIVELIR